MNGPSGPSGPSSRSAGEAGAPIGYYWGDDAYGVNHGPDSLAVRLASGGQLPERVRLAGPSTSHAEIAERVATATLFGGGSLVVVAEPGPLVATKALQAGLANVLAAVAEGNGLAFLDTVDGTARRPASLEWLRKAVVDAGGEVREFPAPKSDQMARWIEERARERQIRITGPAAALLAERVGANVRERDIDRRRQGELAVSELEKLAIYRLDGQITPDDVKALVSDAVPGSTWAFLDAVGSRHTAEALALAQKLESVPGPLLVTHLHRRLRELIEMGDLLASHASAQTIARTLKINQPYRAQRLAEQARTWALPELDAALAGLLELDVALKEGGESRRRVSVALWIAAYVNRPGGRADRARA
jgi:DNA polymerase III delta subunit